MLLIVTECTFRLIIVGVSSTTVATAMCKHIHCYMKFTNTFYHVLVNISDVNLH